MNDEIRLGTPGDLSQIAALEAACFPAAEAATAASFRGRLQHYADCFWLCYRQQQLVGMIDGLLTDDDELTDAMYAEPQRHTPTGRWLMVLGVCTAPGCQHQGVASKLMSHVISQMRQQGRQGIVLTCKQALIPFYEQFGYCCEGPSQSVHGGVTWYQMRLTL